MCPNMLKKGSPMRIPRQDERNIQHTCQNLMSEAKGWVGALA